MESPEKDQPATKEDLEKAKQAIEAEIIVTREMVRELTQAVIRKTKYDF